MAWFDAKIDELEIHVRTSNALKRAGLLYLREVEDKPDALLMVIPGFGKTSLADIRGAILRYRKEWMAR